MTSTAKISCHVAADAPGLILSVKIDDRVSWQGDPCGGQAVAIDINDDEAEHVLVFELSGKTSDHTKVDDTGTITQDVIVSIGDICFDEIKLGHLMCEQAVYKHDFNGTGLPTEEKFYGTMGCNGTVTLKFATPVYLWLLENM